MKLIHITSDERLESLADLILDKEARPLVVLTAGPRRFDLKRLGGAFGQHGAVVAVLHRVGDVERLHEMTYGEMNAYGGAACVFPRSGSRFVIVPRDASSEAFLAMRALSSPRPPTRPAPTRPSRADGRAAFDADDPRSRLDWLRGELDGRGGWAATDAFTRRLFDADDPRPVVRCVSRILDGVDKSHALRSGAPGSPIERRRGRVVWRAYAQNDTPNAWRVHYTRDAEGRVELLACGGHDELV